MTTNRGYFIGQDQMPFERRMFLLAGGSSSWTSRMAMDKMKHTNNDINKRQHSKRSSFDDNDQHLKHYDTKLDASNGIEQHSSRRRPIRQPRRRPRRRRWNENSMGKSAIEFNIENNNNNDINGNIDDNINDSSQNNRLIYYDQSSRPSKRSAQLQLGSNSIISSDRLTQLADPKAIEHQQQRRDNPTNRETILSNYLPPTQTTTPTTTTTSTPSTTSKASLLLGYNQQSIQSISDDRKTISAPTNEASPNIPPSAARNGSTHHHLNGAESAPESSGDMSRLLGSSSLVLLLLVGFIAWRCLWLKFKTKNKSSTCFSGDEWPSVCLLTPKKNKNLAKNKKKKNSETTININGDEFASVEVPSSVEQIQLVERRRPAAAASDSGQVNEVEVGEQSIETLPLKGQDQPPPPPPRPTDEGKKLSALKRRLAKSSLVVAASRAAAKPKVKLLSGRARKFIDDQAREVRQRGDTGARWRPRLAGSHIIGWLTALRSTLNLNSEQQNQKDLDVESNQADRNSQQVRVLVDQYEDEDGNHQEELDNDKQTTLEENAPEQEEDQVGAPTEESIQVTVHQHEHINGGGGDPTESLNQMDVQQSTALNTLQQAHCHLPVEGELFSPHSSPFSLMSSTSPLDHHNRLAVCGCSLVSGTSLPIERSKSQSGGGHSTGCHLNGGHQMEPITTATSTPAPNPYRPTCCSVSPSAMLNNSHHHHHRQPLEQMTTAAGRKCFGANKLGDQTNRIKRHYENYYDDEREDAYRRLTASIGMQFGLTFDNHHHHHHQPNQCQHSGCQPTSAPTTCKCCPQPVVGQQQTMDHQQLMGGHSEQQPQDNSCRDLNCSLCSPQQVPNQAHSMSILVQQPSTATPPPPPPSVQPLSSAEEREKQLDLWPTTTTMKPNDDPTTDRSNTTTGGRSSGNGSDQEPSLASSCLTAANSADHLLTNNNNNNSSSGSLLPQSNHHHQRHHRSSYHSSTSPLSSVSPTSRQTNHYSGGSLNWNPRRRFSCKTAGQQHQHPQQQQQQYQQNGDFPMINAISAGPAAAGWMRPPRRMSIAGDQVRSHMQQRSLIVGQMSSHTGPNSQMPASALLHRASIASDGMQQQQQQPPAHLHHQSLPLASRPRNLSSIGSSHHHNNAHLQQQTAAAAAGAATFRGQSQRPSDASLYDDDDVDPTDSASRHFHCWSTSTMQRSGIGPNSNGQSNYSSSAGSSSGIGFSGSQCTNTPTASATSGFPFGSYATCQAAGMSKTELMFGGPEQLTTIDQYHLMQQQQRQLYNFTVNQLAPGDQFNCDQLMQFNDGADASCFMSSQQQQQHHQQQQVSFPTETSIYRATAMAAPPLPEQKHSRQHQPPFHNQRQQDLTTLGSSRKYSLPVQLESQVASSSCTAQSGGLLFERNHFERVDSSGLSSAPTTAQQVATQQRQQQFKSFNPSAAAAAAPLPAGEPGRTSQDKQQVRRSSQTVTRQSSFWLEDNSLDSVISLTTQSGQLNVGQQSFDESAPDLADDVAAPQPPIEAVSPSMINTDQLMHQLNVELNDITTTTTTANDLPPTSGQEPLIEPSPSSSSSTTNSPRDKRLDAFRFASTSSSSGSPAPPPPPPPSVRHSHHHHAAGRSRLSSSSSSSAAAATSSATPSPDSATKPSERILQLVSSKSSSISKRRLFGGRLRMRRHAGRHSGAAAAAGPSSRLDGDPDRSVAARDSPADVDDDDQRPDRTKSKKKAGDTSELVSMTSHEQEDEFSSVDGDFKNVPGSRPISDLNSASLERQCRDLWKLRATLHDDSCSSVADNWTNYHQRLNRRYDSGYKSIENQFSSSLEGNVSLAAAAAAVSQHQQQQQQSAGSRPQSGCSGFIQQQRTVAKQRERPASQTSTVSAEVTTGGEQSATKILMLASPLRVDTTDADHSVNSKLRDLNNPLEEVCPLGQLNLNEPTSGGLLLGGSMDEKGPDEGERCHSRSSGGSSTNDQNQNNDNNL